MLKSKRADQVGARAQRLAQQMRTGQWQLIYGRVIENEPESKLQAALVAHLPGGSRLEVEPKIEIYERQHRKPTV